MLNWLKSIHVKTLGIMMLATVMGLAFSYLVINSIEYNIQVHNSTQSIHRSAEKILTLAESGASYHELLSALSLLSGDKVTLLSNGKVVAGSATYNSRDSGQLISEVTSGPLKVIVSRHVPYTDTISAEVTGGAVVLVLLALLAAVFISKMFTNSVSDSISEAIHAAERVASGDLTARIGEVGSREFQSLARAFDSMAAKLEDHENEQKKFLGDLSHEIATPINAVSGFALAICDRTIKTQDELSEAAWLIQEETDRINHLLQDLRTLDRLDIAHTVSKESFYIDLYIKELVLRFSSNTASKFLTIVWDAPHEEVFLDRRLLDMVVSNFFSNSIRYVDPKGKIRIGVKKTHGEILISVSDNGIGIAPKHLNRIFDRLYRVDEARDRASGGSGLGLAIARRATQSLGGKIEVVSESGKGSEFRLIIPLEVRGEGESELDVLDELSNTADPVDAEVRSSSTSTTN